MGMTIEELKAYCMEQEYNHRLSCKRYDDASGYTRSQNKDIRAACAVREELLGDYYQQIAQILRKYQMMQADYEARLKADKVAMLEDLKKEMNPIKECEYQIYGKEHWNFVGKCQDVIQQKIDKLKEVEV